MSLRSRLTGRARPNISAKAPKSASNVSSHADIQSVGNLSVKEGLLSPTSFFEAAAINEKWDFEESKHNLCVKSEVTCFEFDECKKLSRDDAFKSEECIASDGVFLTNQNALDVVLEEKLHVHPVDELPVEVYDNIVNQTAVLSSMMVVAVPTSSSAAVAAVNVVDLDLDPGQAGDTEDSDREIRTAKSQAYNMRVLDFGAIRRQETAAAQREHTRRARQVATAAGTQMDKTQMKMRDLIYWNPESQPPPKWRQERDVERLKQKETRRQSVVDCDTRSSLSGGITLGDKICDVAVLSDLDLDEEEMLQKSINKSASTSSVKKDLVAPEVVLDAHGNIVLNEESLVLRDLPSTEVMEEVKEGWNDLRATYRSFRTETHRTRFWSDRETTRFYKALSTIGTDFSFMASVFRQRTREELKRKFKREEKRNPHLVNIALKSRRKYNLSIYDQSSEEDESFIGSLEDSTVNSLVGEGITHRRVNGRRSVTAQLRNTVLATKAKLNQPPCSSVAADDAKPLHMADSKNKLKAANDCAIVDKSEVIDSRQVLVTRMSASSLLTNIKRKRSCSSKFIKLDASVTGESPCLIGETGSTLPLAQKKLLQVPLPLPPSEVVDVMMQVGKDVFPVKRETALSCVDILKLAINQEEYDTKEAVISLYKLSESAAHRLEQVFDTRS